MIKNLLGWVAPRLFALSVGTLPSFGLSESLPPGAKGQASSTSLFELATPAIDGEQTTHAVRPIASMSALTLTPSDSIREVLALSGLHALAISAHYFDLPGASSRVDTAQLTTPPSSTSRSVVTLAPPRVGDYWVSVTRQSGGVLVFDGYAPDDATRTRFSEVDGADVNFLRLGSGQPDAYATAVDFGLELLGRLSEGRFALRGDVFSISGIALSSADYDSTLVALETRLPQGIELGEVAVAAPPAATYIFEFEVQNGTTTLNGLLPDQAFEAELLAEAGAGASSAVDYASGEPPSFAVNARQAANFLPWLVDGTIRFDGTAWSVIGTPGSEVDRGAIESEFSRRGLDASGWTLSLEDVPAVATTETAGPDTPGVGAPVDDVVAPDTPTAEDATPPASASAEAEPAVEAPTSPPTSPEDDSVAETPATPSPDEEAATLTACQTRLAELSAHNAILFQSGAAVIAESAVTELDAFAQVLATCPETRIYVDGHTDSDGDDRLNLVLSVSRAEAVVDALIERGIAAERLYAVGYGETQPIASNETPDGRRQNRRIVITVEPAD